MNRVSTTNDYHKDDNVQMNLHGQLFALAIEKRIAI